jgi:NADPH:quinone reductase-like Zn-dependent oxidoreductase
MAAARGARVIGRVSHEAKAELGRAAGASDILIGADGSFARQVLDLTDPRPPGCDAPALHLHYGLKVPD